MNRIKLLDQSVIDQIAAGEIIERPASVVKELVENAIDAGATEITVELEEGGRKLIRVTDNGSGIYPDDLPLAALSHATSKLTGPQDLFEVTSLGFRGEALASIAAVSRLSIASRTPDLSSGTRISSEFGALLHSTEIGMAQGTTVEVRDLFSNLPARLKFLRAQNTEVSHCSDMLTRFALSYPSIGFRLRSGTRTTYYPPAPGDLRRRVRECLGDDVADSLIEVEGADDRVGTITGLISAPPFARANSRVQYTFLNGRYIKDRQIQSAISEAYRGRLTVGQYPMVFLSLVMDPGQFDVNVHPTKVEVRFLESNRIFSFVLLTLVRSLDRHREPLPAGGEPHSGLRPEMAEGIRNAITASYRNPPRQDYGPLYGGSPRNAEREGKYSPDLIPKAAVGDVNPLDMLATTGEPRREVDGWRYIGAFADTYLMFDDGEDLIVIDQHALHERVLFARLKAQTGPVTSQQLLIPQAIELSASEYSYWEAAAQSLAGAGFDVEPFGERTVAIHAVPQCVPVEQCAELLQRSIAEASGESAGDPDALLATMACKAAVKAGERLVWNEVRELVRLYRELETSATTCPHGRPALVRVAAATVRKWFKRT